MISENILRKLAHQGEHQTNLERVLADELLKLLILKKAKSTKSCEACFHLAVCKITKNIGGVWQPLAPSGHPGDHCQHFAPITTGDSEG